MYQIYVFISHSWKYSGHYDKLSEWIYESWTVERLSIKFIDTSVPKEHPIHNAPNDTALRDAIFKKIEASHVIVILIGMYVHYSKWINKEIDSAEEYKKPILAVNPWGQERKCKVVEGAAHKIVSWQKQSVIDGIWNLYNGERYVQKVY